MPKLPSGKPLAAAIAVACAIAAPVVVNFEGTVHRPYLDPVQILTACSGHTGPELKLGQKFTPEQCGEMLDADLRKHAEGVARCTPMIFEKPKVAAAITSFTYNVGESAYCKSTAARHFRAGNYRAGCEAISKYVYAGGKKLKGLVRRRQAEVKMCLEGIG